jgi:hypothetical protein
MIANQIAGFLGFAGAAVATDYESIATANPSGASTFDFTSIPSGYSHLQIRYSTAASSGGTGIRIRFNGNSSANYQLHFVGGDGSTASAGVGGGAELSGSIGLTVATTSITSVGVVDILDYTSTNKNKTVRSLFGYDANGSGFVRLISSLFFATPAAVTSITIFPSSGTLTGTFALYGIK